MKNWVLLLSLLFAAAPLSLLSNDSNTEKQLSLEIYPKWYSQDDITIQGNIGVEKLFQQHDWVTYYIKPSTTYALDRNWAIHGGLGFYYTDNKTLNNVKEWRPFVGLSHFTNFTEPKPHKYRILIFIRSFSRYSISQVGEAGLETDYTIEM